MKKIFVLVCVMAGIVASIWFFVLDQEEIKNEALALESVPDDALADTPVDTQNPSKAEELVEQLSEPLPEQKSQEKSGELLEANSVSKSLPGIFKSNPVSNTNEPGIAVVAAVDKYKVLFPSAGVGHMNIDKIGLVDEEVTDIEGFLESRTTLSGGDSPMGGNDREQCGFFRELSNQSFRGKIFFGGTENVSLPVFVSVSDSVQPGEDQIRINDKVGSRLLEHRIVRQNEGGIWQMDLHKLGVYLPQDRCPWSDEYSVERKQLFYLMRSKKLVANVYCGNKGKNNYIWKKIGIIIAESN